MKISENQLAEAKRIVADLILDEHYTLRFNGTLPDSYQLKMHEKPYHPTVDGTACWSFVSRGTLEYHRISFGCNMIDRIAGNMDSVGFYGLAFYRHELAHSLWSSRELERLKKDCEKASISFMNLNLFEDARIEHLWRKAHGKFDWLKYEKICEKFEAPQSYIHSIISFEEDYSSKEYIKFFESLKVPADAKIPDPRKHLDFYNEAIKAKSTDEVIPIVKRWEEYFKVPKTPSGGGASDKSGGDGSQNEGRGVLEGDMIAALEASLIEGREGISTATLSGDRNKAHIRDRNKAHIRDRKNNEDFEGAPTEVNDAGESPLLSDDPIYNLDWSNAERLARRFRRVFKKSKERVRKISSSNRLSVKAMERGSDRIYKHWDRGDARDKRKVVIIFDCSGSMNGVPHQSGLILLEIFNTLAAWGKIDVDVILSGGDRYDAISHLLKFPVRREVITRVNCHCGIEGFHAAMTRHKKLVLGADYVFVYTDGNITDTPIDKSKWNALGLYTFGAYVGHKSVTALSRYFDACISENSIEELCDHLIRMLIRHRLT